LAINKRKVLDAARRYAQKGAKEKALKVYNKLVQADPRDAKLLLEVGDAYRRWGQAEEAIAQYNKVAIQYKQDGFDARAVAVLKQILNLDPKRPSAHVSLAELYQRMGLDSDAVSALQTAADSFYRDGNRREALELLRKMASLDPSNTTSRLKVADLLRQQGLDEDAVAEYEEVAAELKRQGGSDQLAVVQERILEIQPGRVDVLTALAQSLSDLGQPERAEAFAIRAVDAAKAPEQYELLCGIYKSLGNEVRMAELTRDLAGLYRDRGDEDLAREVMQRLPAESVANTLGVGDNESEVEDDTALGEEELLEDDDFLVAEDDPGVPESDTADPDLGAAVEEPLPEGDSEQLLAEASVYLRYGKRAQAIASLNAVLLQEPAHRGALEKLGEAHAEGDATADAVECWTQAAELAREAGDASCHEILRDRIAALDPVAASALESMDDASESEPDAELDIELGDAEPEPEMLDESEEFELDLDVSVEVALPGEEPPVVESESDDFDFDIDIDAEIEVQVDEAELDLAEDVEEDEEPGPALEAELELDTDGLEFDLDEAADDPVQGSAPVGLDAGSESASTDFGQSTATAEQIKGDMEEAEFYIQQGLEAEAEVIYRRVLRAAPNHPGALLKLGELAASRGEDPAIAAELQSESDSSALDTEGGVDDADEFASDDGIEVSIGDEEDESLAEELDLAIDEPESLEFAADAGEADPAEADTGVQLEFKDAELELVIDDSTFDGVDDEGAEADEEPDEEEVAGFELDLSADEADDDDLTDLSGDENDDTLIAKEEIDATAETEVWSLADEESGQAEDDLIGEDATQVEAVEPRVAEAAFSTDSLIPEARRVIAIDDTMPIADVGEPDGSPEPLAASGAAGAEGVEGEESFDLAGALADVFDDADTEADANENSGVLSTVEAGFESLFADFKKGVSASLDEGDFETRYDLGIAYREMGLLDDAIDEFRCCLECPNRRFESLYMMGLCTFDLGRVRDAVSHLEQALATPDLPEERMVGVQFDLGRAYQAIGDAARARDLYQTVQRIDSSFPEIEEQLASVQVAEEGEEAALELQEPAENEYESFDDLMSDDDDDPDEEIVEAETFESFDDLVTEAGREIDEATVEMTSESESGREDVPDPPSRPSSSDRKKKISFV
jgi:pilus assembly protein FimV